MTLPYPRSMPSRGPKDQVFELERVDSMAPEARGRIGGVSVGFPLWKTTMSIGTLNRDQSDEWRGFILSQRGAQRLFVGFEIARQMPRNYQNGFPGGFTGVPSSWLQSVDSNGFAVLRLSGLPAGLALTTGDYVDFRWNTYSRALVRLLEPATANGSGVLSASIEPPVPALVPLTAVAHLDNPGCLMKLMSETAPGPLGRRGAMESGTVVAIQDLIP